MRSHMYVAPRSHGRRPLPPAARRSLNKHPDDRGRTTRHIHTHTHTHKHTSTHTHTDRQTHACHHHGNKRSSTGGTLPPMRRPMAMPTRALTSGRPGGQMYCTRSPSTSRPPTLGTCPTPHTRRQTHSTASGRRGKARAHGRPWHGSYRGGIWAGRGGARRRRHCRRGGPGRCRCIPAPRQGERSPPPRHRRAPPRR
jgi:hypothetical protein